MEEREWVKVRGQGCRARVCMGPGESVNPLSLSSLLHNVGAAPPPAQSPEEQRRPTGPMRLCWGLAIWEPAKPWDRRVGECQGQGAATHCLALFLILPGCPLPHLQHGLTA